MLTIYNLIPKWLVMALLVGVLIVCGIQTIRTEYYKIDNAKLTNDNKILTENVTALNASLDTCTKSLKAEADNCVSQGKITQDTEKTKTEIKDICVKEKPGEKTDIMSAIDESNALSGRFNGVLPTR